MRNRHRLLRYLVLSGIVLYKWPVTRRSFLELYEGDPAIAASLQAFRQIPVRKLEVDGYDWTYYQAGDGPRTLLFLHGMAGAYDIWWRQLLDLQQDYRVVAVTCPPVPSLKEMGRGLEAILSAEGIEAVTVIGSSLGGYVAQYLAATFPARVEAAVLANTYPPNGLVSELNRRLGKLLPLLPEWLIMYMMRRNIRKVVVPAAEGSPLVKAYLLEQGCGKMSGEQFYARFCCVVDRFEDPVPGDLPVLIIESDNDPMIPAEWRAKLRERYPDAQLHTFYGKGHFPYLNEAEAYTKVLRGYIDRL
jgi:maspardin